MTMTKRNTSQTAMMNSLAAIRGAYQQQMNQIAERRAQATLIITSHRHINFGTIHLLPKPIRLALFRNRVSVSSSFGEVDRPRLLEWINQNASGLVATCDGDDFDHNLELIIGFEHEADMVAFTLAFRTA